jgi:hypothetical protein
MRRVPPTRFCYFVHGLCVIANQPMPALIPAPVTDRPDLRIWIGPLAKLQQRHPALDFLGMRDAGPSFCWRQSALQGQVVVHRIVDPKLTLLAILTAAGDAVEVGWQSNMTLPPDELEATIANYFAQAWLGMALRLAGRLVLHGNVVDVDGRGLAWLGDKGAGKSTLTAAFVAAGHPLLSDDQIAPWFELDKVSIAPGILRLHLWPQSLAAMSPVQEPYHFDQPFAVFPKGYVTFAPPQVAPETPLRTPLRAIYILQPRQAGLSAATVATPTAGQGFHLLYHHCLARRILPLTPEQRRAEFQAVGELHRRVPVRLLTLPDDLACLPDVVQMLAEDAAA